MYEGFTNYATFVLFHTLTNNQRVNTTLKSMDLASVNLRKYTISLTKVEKDVRETCEHLVKNKDEGTRWKDVNWSEVVSEINARA